jgi:hypothetical protein
VPQIEDKGQHTYVFFQVSTPVVLGESYLNRRDVRDPALHAESQNMFIYFYHLAPSISHLALALYYQDLSGLADSCRTVGK